MFCYRQHEDISQLKSLVMHVYKIITLMKGLSKLILLLLWALLHLPSLAVPYLNHSNYLAHFSVIIIEVWLRLFYLLSNNCIRFNRLTYICLNLHKFGVQ